MISVGTAEAFLDEVAQAVLQAVHAEGVDHVGHESLHEHGAGLGLGDAALAHIEEGVGGELACGGSVRALYVVAVDFKLRLGVHPRIRSGEEIGRAHV